MESAGPGARVRQLLATHWMGLAAVLLGTVVNAAVLTDGTAEIAVPPSRFALFYDDLGDSLLEGRFDVSLESIGDEAFIIDGRVYGYFGPTPALLRIPLNALFPGMRGLWTRPLMIAATFFTLLATYLILRMASGERQSPARGARAWLAGAFVLCAAVGTPMLFISRRPIVYHEASGIAVAFATWTYAFVLGYLRGGRLRSALAATACALLALQARGSVGVGALASVFLLVAVLALELLGSRWPWSARVAAALGAERSEGGVLPNGRSLRIHALVLAAVAVLSTSAIAYKNHQVFGGVMAAPPLSRHVTLMFNRKRLAKTGGNFFQPVNIRTTLYSYLCPTQVELDPDKFPFVFPVSRWNVRTFPEAKLDHVEEFVSLTAVNPLWIVLAGIGIVVAVRPGLAKAPALARFRIAFAGAAAGAVAIFLVACVTHRYLHDAYPLLVIGGACGVEGAVALGSRGRWWKVACLSAGVLLAVYTCYANAAVTMTQPRW